uniref:(northern house mosquito) hypothetical protein n=1 Tax=Culex pipiens TaxID=7175 RepID=A0A8D8MZ07_CULPI
MLKNGLERDLHGLEIIKKQTKGGRGRRGFELGYKKTKSLLLLPAQTRTRWRPQLFGTDMVAQLRRFHLGRRQLERCLRAVHVLERGNAIIWFKLILYYKSRHEI